MVQDMKIAESFTLPPLSDDEDDAPATTSGRNAVAGRALKAAAKNGG